MDHKLRSIITIKVTQSLIRPKIRETVLVHGTTEDENEQIWVVKNDWDE